MKIYFYFSDYITIKKNYLYYVILGFYELSKSSYEESASLFYEALKRAPHVPEINIALGQALLEIDVDKAINCFRLSAAYAPLFEIM